MQHLRYAFRFIGACFSLALKHPRLRKPVFNLWMGGMGLLTLWLIPMLGVIALIGVRPLGLVLIGFFISLLLFSLLAWSEVTALETCLAFDDLTWIDLELPGSSQNKQDHARWQQILLWTLLQPGLLINHLFNQILRPQHAEELAWLSGAYLMLPVIALEDFNLKEGIDRIKQLLRDRLIRFHPSLISIHPLTGVVQWLLIVASALLGLKFGFKLAPFLTAGLLSRLLAVVVGALIAGVLALLGLSISSYNRSCYHTTLYQWVLSVENARMTGDASQGAPPKLLSQVLKTNSRNQKES